MYTTVHALLMGVVQVGLQVPTPSPRGTVYSPTCGVLDLSICQQGLLVLE